MATEKATNAAKHIIEDRHGSDYYKDTNLLAKYLQNALNISVEKAEVKSKAIQQDRKGANYYEDPKILADYLED